MKLLVILFLSALTLAHASPVEAAKPRNPATRTAKSSGSAIATGYSKAKLSRNTNSVILTFINLGNVSKITYTLSYTANGIEQGAMGSITPAGNATDSRDVYFGTCSHGVCTPHRGIQNASLVVETHLKNGRTNVKRYKIRI